MTRTELETRIEDLRRQRGAAVLDGQKRNKFDEELDTLQVELVALADAESEATRRAREQDAKDAASNVKAKIKRIAELEQRRLAAWGDLEAATRAQLKAIGKIVSATESQRVLHGDITPGAVPNGIGPYETAHKIGGRIAELLSSAPHRVRLGGLAFEGVGGIYASAVLDDWKEAERKVLGPYIKALLEE